MRLHTLLKCEHETANRYNDCLLIYTLRCQICGSRPVCSDDKRKRVVLAHDRSLTGSLLYRAFYLEFPDGEVPEGTDIKRDTDPRLPADIPSLDSLPAQLGRRRGATAYPCRLHK